MTPRELVFAMMEHGASRGEAEAQVRDTLGGLGAELARAGSADIPGIGSFQARITTTAARQAVNPFTRQPMTVAARRRVQIRFVPDPALVEAVSRVPQSPDDEGLFGRRVDPLHRAFVQGLNGKAGQLTLPGVGNFRVCKVPAMRARVNPRTGAVIAPATPSSRTVRFSPMAALKRASLPAPSEEEA